MGGFRVRLSLPRFRILCPDFFFLLCGSSGSISSVSTAESRKRSWRFDDDSGSGKESSERSYLLVNRVRKRKFSSLKVRKLGHGGSSLYPKPRFDSVTGRNG